VIAYGSQIANGSQDPTTFEMTYALPPPGLAAVQHDETLVGDGTAAAPLGVADGAVTTLKIADGSVAADDIADGAVTQAKLSAAEIAPGRVLITNGSVLKWRDDGVALPFAGVTESEGDAFAVANTRAGAIFGESPLQTGVTGLAGSSTRVPPPVEAPVGVYGQSETGVGVVGFARDFPGVVGHSVQAEGVYGLTNSTYGVAGRTGAPIDGALPASKAGVLGQSRDSVGVLGASTVNVGVAGSGSTGIAGNGVQGHGVHGQTTSAAAYGGSFVNVGAGGGGGAYVRGASDESPDLVLGAGGASAVRGRIASDPAHSTSWIDISSKAGVVIELDSDKNAAVGTLEVRDGNDVPLLVVEEDADVRVPDLGSGGTLPVSATPTGYLVLGGASDARLKTDVVPLGDEIDVMAALARLRGVRFSWDTTQERARELGTRRELGVIAQDVEGVLPELVVYDREGYRAVDYARLTAFLIEVAKAQERLIEAQDGAIRGLLDRVAALEAGTVPAPAPARAARGDLR
jgi:hypothetical protein